ncbi:hypothetical protein HanXRQr2_Chr03g0091171 [Helianthus annuus]|uniref:Uncharacterized protein n=2 Tax=Helianthus annuus TaxID=4232 RepID=A0A251V4U0_HELAN|nr:hypothetical protein HanXRQr2_Chr03g0091171 [Helianthus annuus]KAJ0496039.1 hypothetical protein HanIR_Chr12g0615661 [Helianthus annuus]KAJ0942092.1 hypothetical protein HanPSC8_Chr03g0087791 [Helianthus annuus]
MGCLARKSVIFLVLMNILICFSCANNVLRDRQEGRELLLLGRVAGWVASRLPKVKEAAYQAELKIAEHYVKKFAESIAGKLFGSGGQKGFGVGWKAGKLYYSVADKCENRTIDLQYETTTSPCNNTCGDSESVPCVIYCVLEVINITGLIDRCFESCGAPIETPCLYMFNDTGTCQPQTTCSNISNGTITCPHS